MAGVGTSAQTGGVHLIFRDDENTAYLQARVPWIVLTMLAAFFAVTARLYYLQILSGNQYRKVATELLLREEEVVARRGNILDRNNVLLADTRPQFELTLTPQHAGDSGKVLSSLARLLPVAINDMRARLDRARFAPGFMPVVIVSDAPYEWAAILRQHLKAEYDANSATDFSGVALNVTPLRRYAYPESFAHVLGYLKQVDRERLDILEARQPGVYSAGDMVGASGLEQAYDVALKGADGITGRVVDARGREATGDGDLAIIAERARIAEHPGYHLRTTLDFDAQRAAEEALHDKKGAVVALDPETGGILVLVSSPSFNANRIMKNIDRDYWRKINLDEDRYLFNRAIQGMYPPASTYKPVDVVAGIAEGVLDPKHTTFSCSGGLRFGNRFFKCWHRGHGRLGVIAGLAQSCDVFFYQTGLKLGVDTIAHYAGIMGFGRLTGVDLPFEKPGLIPTKEWKLQRFGKEWIESETLSVAIGQSYDLVTPLQNAKMAAMVANGGYEITPHAGLAILNPDGSIAREITYPKKTTPLTGTEAITTAKLGMIEVVQGRGTAVRLKASPYRIAGKTGTAQVIGHESKARRSRKTDNHGLFIGFAPHEAPRIAVAVIVENGGSGSGAAAPIAQKVIDTYLGKIMPLPKEERKTRQ